MPVRLILLRHGETDWNAEDRYQGRTDVDLNATGQRQARAAVARFLAGALEDADELVAVASPLTRARRTAEIVLEAAVGDAELTLDPDLMELHGGDWEGLRLTEIAERWPAEHEAWRGTPDLDAGPVAGETLRAGGQRVLAALGEHVPPAWTPARGAGERAPQAPVLLAVAHGGVLRSAVGQLLGAEGEDFAALERIENACAVVFEGDCAAGGPSSRRIVDGCWQLRGYNV